MTTKQVLNIHNLIVIQQTHWFICLIAYLPISINQQHYRLPGLHLLIWLLLGMLPLVFYKIQERIKAKVFCWGIYLLILLGIYLLPVPHNVYTYVYLGVTAYHCVSSSSLKASLKNYEDYKPISLWIILTICLVEIFILQYVGLFEYQKGLLYLLIFNVVLYFVAGYINSYVKYLVLNRHSIGYMPVGSVLCSGILSVVGFSGILAILSVVIINIGEMGDLIQYFIRFKEFLVNKIREGLKKFVKEKGVEQEFNEPLFEQTLDFNPMLQEERTSVFDIILSVLLLIAFLVLVFNLIKCIYRIAMALLVYRPKKSEEEEAFLEVQDVVEKLNKRKREGFFEARTPEMRIRRRFRKKILYEKETIAGEGDSDRMELYTARECSDILKKPTLAALYEKARYSPYECTAEDVKQMKDACKN